MRTLLRLLLLGLSVVLIACGGSGGAPDSDTTLPPPRPDGLTAIAGNGQVALSWTASPGATTYHVKRAALSSGPWVEIATPTATYHLDAGLDNGSTWFYVVSAAKGGSMSDDSAVVSATPSPELPLLPPDDLSRNALGMNTWFLNDWDGSFAFVDAMKHARPWRAGADWHADVAVDDDGWPTADASTVIQTGSPQKINGTYTLVFNGQADVSLMWAGGTVSDMMYDPASNTSTAHVTYAISSEQSVGLIFMNTRRTASSALHSGFRNVRLYRPGYATDGSAVFTSAFLAALSKTATLRLMDWTATNNNLVVHWSQRLTPLQMNRPGPSYTGPGGGVWTESELGVALEHQIQLCNTVHADCWINIPPAAADDYVEKVALTLRYGSDGRNPYTGPQAHPLYPPLNADLHVYLEYANEIWNSAGGFQSFHVIHDMVSSLAPDHVLKQFAPAGANVYQLLYCYPAMRMARISDIFRGVYGDASMMNRIRPLLMTQQGDANGTLSLPLNWLHAYAAGQAGSPAVSHWLYGAGGSAYYGVNGTVAEQDRGNAALFFAEGNYPDAQMLRGIGVDAVLAANFGLRRIAYEGGLSLDYYTEEQANAINLDARMEDMMIRTHDGWSANGGDLLVYYTVVGPPPWEFTPDIADADSPKMRGLDQLATRTRAPVTLGVALPGSIVARDWSAYRVRSGYDYDAMCDGLPCIGGNDEGEWIALPAHAASAYTAALVVNAASFGGAVVEVRVNGELQGQITLPDSGTLADSSSLPVAIPAGLAVIRLHAISGGFNLHSLKLPRAL